MWRDLRFAAVLLLVAVLAVAIYVGRPMLVIGSVYDPDGRPIAGAYSYSHRGFSQAARDWSEGSDSHRIVSGCLFCGTLDVRVRAKGYESEEIKLSFHYPMDTGDRILVHRRLFGMVNRVRVTLYPAQRVEQKVCYSELLFRRGRPDTVLAVHPELSGRARLEDLNLRLRELTRGRELHAPYIALEASTDDEGNIAMRTDGNEANGGPPQRAGYNRRTQPASLRLTLHHLDGGFILVEPMTGVPRYNGLRETYRRLREAPAAGYQRQITLDFDRAHLDGDQFFFYCRIGDHFGKGRITAPYAMPTRPDEISANIEIFLNAEGGRALPRGR